MKLFIFIVMIPNPSFKMTGFANVDRTTASTRYMYILGKISNHQEFGLYMKNNFKNKL